VKSDHRIAPAFLYRFIEGGFIMYCPKCGQEVSDYTRICSACGELLENPSASSPQPGFSQPQQPQSNFNSYDQQPQPNYTNYQQPQPNTYQPMPTIPDYKVQSILLLVFSAVCCNCINVVSLAFAIVALVTSGKIPQHLAAGNIDLAWETSRKTKMWCWISFGILILGIIVSVIVTIALLTSPEYQNILKDIMNSYGY
jgi:hypothetical protein